jgi:KaiC/GvpD/RAD55 family RecA-like ATPase
MDFDKPGAFDAWLELVTNTNPEFADTIRSLPRVRTPDDGVHLYCRCREIAGSTKLARAKEPFAGPTGKPKVTIIETKGEGGYVIAPPSPAKCHQAGKPYLHDGGLPITQVPEIEPAVRRAMHAAARAFDEVAAQATRPPPQPHDGVRPGDDFNTRGPTWRQLLEPAGWTIDHAKGEVLYWRRPGKEGRGCSATTGHCGDTLYCFSSNAQPFDAERSYDKFGAYARLSHGGDCGRATKELGRLGYGEQPPASPPPDDTPHTVSDQHDTRPWMAPDRKATWGPQTMADGADEWESLADIACIPTQVGSLNRALGGGWPIGQVSIILAYTGVGKSEFARQTAWHAASIGHGVVHVDIELGIARLYERALAHESQVPPTRLRDRNVRTQADAAAIRQARARLVAHDRTIYLCPNGAPPLEELEVKVRTAIDSVRDAGDDVPRPPMVILDSVQRLSFGAPSDDMRVRMIYFMGWAEALAKSTKTAVVMISEQKRGQDGGIPAPEEILTSGAESRSLEFVADTVVGLVPEDKLTDLDCGAADEPWERRVQLVVAKNRNGKRGYLGESVVFTGPCWGMRVEQRHKATLETEIVLALTGHDGGLSTTELTKLVKRRKHDVVSACGKLSLAGEIEHTGSGPTLRWLPVPKPRNGYFETTRSRDGNSNENRERVSSNDLFGLGIEDKEDGNG